MDNNNNPNENYDNSSGEDVLFESELSKSDDSKLMIRMPVLSPFSYVGVARMFHIAYH
jgi:hypothetical protein